MPIHSLSPAPVPGAPVAGSPEGQLSPFLRRYYLAHFGKSLFWYLSSILFAYYLTEACGLAPATMGIVLAASLALNAVADAAIGTRLAVHVRGTADACHHQFAGGVAASLAILAFAATALVPESWRLAYALVTLCGFRLCYSLYDVPQNAILGFASRTDCERARIAGARQMLSASAQLAIALLFVPFLRDETRGDLAVRFMLVVVGACLVALVSAALLKRAGRHEVAWTATLDDDAIAGGDNVDEPAFGGLHLLIAAAIFAFIVSTIRLVEPYVASFSLIGEISAAFMMSLALGQLVGPLYWARHGAAHGLTRSLTHATLLMLFATGGFAFMNQGLAFTIVIGLIHGFATAGISQMIWAMAARWSRQGDKRATRHFGLLTFSTKSANASASLCFGLLLSAGDYRGGGTIWSIPMLILMGIPAVGALLLLLLMPRVRR
ncbi:MAG: hypothetical protein CVT77_01205 [Alphaproteobacteria bacterium HGW-Alphaproteobacteria-16]|nr:MAG: hypothetical protein CVT77_01205 [Alphaproteobacteria bacterium HGW-Alphaproteobacteria-16]